MKLRPSALPILDQSPLFEPGDSSIDANRGTYRHTVLARYFREQSEDVLFDLEEEEIDAIKWASDQIRILGPGRNHAVSFEVPVSIHYSDFEEMIGKIDAVAGNHFWDLKWRPRDYDLQMSAYALGLLQETNAPLVYAHVLFGATRRVRTLEFDLASATRDVEGVVARSRAASRCRTSAYCSWCRILPRCEVYTEQALAVANGREDWSHPGTFHSSEIDDPVEMGKALRLARLLRKWVESVEFHAIELATKKGLVPEGFEIKATSGKRYVNDVQCAFTIAGVDQDSFLRCCDLRLNTSRDYPDKIGLVEVYAKLRGMKKAPAKREILELLEPVISKGRDGIKLKAITETEEDDYADI